MTARERLPNRRPHVVFVFEHEGHRYRATASRYPDGRLAEIFLDSGNLGTAVQTSAETSAILASLALQHGVLPETILRAVKGPIATAIELAVQA